MLERILQTIKNYFIMEVHSGVFSISDGMLEDIDFLLDGQYFKIHGSVLNDGIYQWPATGLSDEVFKGEIWALAVPKELVDLAGEVTAWTQANADVIRSPYMSESFGGYSYSKGSGGGAGAGSGGVSWKSVFADRLAPWRKARYDARDADRKGGGVSNGDSRYY